MRKRLTEKDASGYSTKFDLKSVFARLFVYEDLFFDEKGNEIICYDRLRYIAEAERNGAIPRLKLGDKVYWIAGRLEFMYGEIAEFTVTMVSIGVKTGGWQYRASAPTLSGNYGNSYKGQHSFKESEIGTKYYLTYEDAKAALLEGKK